MQHFTENFDVVITAFMNFALLSVEVVIVQE